MRRTHVVGGVALWLGTSVVLPLPPLAVLAGVPVAASAALWPDIDSEQSTATRWFGPAGYPLSMWVKRRLGGHRGGAHSLLVGVPLCGLLGLLGMAVVLALGAAWFDASLGVLWPLIAVSGGAAFVGALSHSLLDSLTNGGVAWLWPWRRRRYGLTLMVVGGWGESVVVRPVLVGLSVVAGVATVMGW